MRKSCMLLMLLTVMLLLPANPLLAVGLSIDGTPRTFMPEPYIDKSSVMVPLRAVMESMGATVSWNSVNSSIVCTQGPREMVFKPGSAVVYCDGQKKELPAAVTLQGAAYFMPARAVVEAIGGTVEWRNNGVEITSGPGHTLPGKPSLESAPGFHVSSSSAAQGHMMMLWMEPCLASDRISFSSDIPGVSNEVYEHGKNRFKLIGIESDVPPANYSYRVILERQGIRLVDAAGMLRVQESAYPVQNLWVDSSLEAWRDPALAALDQEKTARALSTSSLQALWDQTFLLPCSGPITTEYGARRSVNGAAPYPHSGIDIAADYGVPVKASNRGLVKLAAMLNATGNTVIIDHGCGVYSSYCHLDDMYVQAGDEVERSETIGTVGSTGFSTGPHLHWITGVDGNPLDPSVFIDNNPLWALN